MASIRTGVWSSVAICATGFTGQVAAQEAGSELEEVLVTAERRSNDLQNVAVSVSVRTGEELSSQGRYTTKQILEDVPGVVAVDNGTINVGTADVQGNNITIRGITPGGPAGGPNGISASPGTAVYVDGVYEGVGSGYDIERVEVLRGPQGTLYGRSATSGVVAFHTRNPTFDGVTGNAAIEFADYDLQHYSAAVNIPMGDKFAARLSGDYYDQGNGYFDQANRGMTQRTNGRAKLLWQPNEAFSLLVGLAYEDRDDFSGGNSTTAKPPTLAQTTVTSDVFPGNKKTKQYWAEANWDVGPVTLTYLPAFRSWEQDDLLLQSSNFISSGVPLHQRFLTPKDDFLTQELRVSSQADSKVQWQGGVFYYHNELQNSNNNYLANPDGSTYEVLSTTDDQKDTKDLGFFAEATFALNESTRATLGARYDETKMVVSETFFNNPFATCGTPLQFLFPLPPGVVCTGVARANVPPPPPASLNGVELNFYNFNYKVRLEHDLTEKNMLYGMVSTGFRPGDVGIVNRAPNYLDAEKLTSFEVGSKNRFLDNSLQLNVGLYYYDYQGFQTSYRPNTPNPADFAGIGNTVATTVPATNIGGELELLYQLTAHDRIGFNYNYVESKWKDKPAEFASAQPETKRAMTPSTISANYEHLFTLSGGSTLSARIDGRYESAHLTQNLHADFLALGYDQYAHVGSRTIGNLSASWANVGGRYTVTAYVRNFTDAQYTTYTVLGDPTSLGVGWNDPRTYGAMLNVRF